MTAELPSQPGINPETLTEPALGEIFIHGPVGRELGGHGGSKTV